MPNTQTSSALGRLDLLVSRAITGVCTASQDPAWMSFERRYRGPIKELATRYLGPLDGQLNVAADADDEDDYEYEYHDADCTCGECEEDDGDGEEDDSDYEEPEDDDSDSDDTSDDSDVIDAEFEMVEN